MSDVNCRVYTLWLSDEMANTLNHIAVEDNVSVASIIRELIADYIDLRYDDDKWP